MTEGPPDRYGKPTAVMVETAHTAHGYAPQVSVETNGVQQVLNTDRGTLYFRAPHFCDAEPEDQFVIRGDLYDVVGTDSDWWHPNGDHKGNTIVVERTNHTK